MKNLTAMVAAAKAGKLNYLVFSLSSHGTQVPDKNRDEPDRADEAFCPHDLAQKGNVWDPNFIILDDELHDLFVQLPKNVLLEVYLDTCHSGTGLKSVDMLLDRNPRYLPPPSLKAFLAVDGRKSRGLHESMLEKGLVHHILWAGCRSDQTSADAKIGGAWHGATVLTAVVEKPRGYGRIVRARDESLLAIVEEKDAADDVKRIREINSGLFCVEKVKLFEALAATTRDNVQRAYYLTDVIGVLKKRGHEVRAYRVADPREVSGVNTEEELRAVRGYFEELS